MKKPSTSTTTTDPKTPAAKLLNSRTIYGDRFIPSRSSSKFALFNLPNSTTSNGSSSDDTNSAYTTLLKSALFEPECVGGVNGFQPLTPEKSVSSGRFGSGNSDSSFLQISPPNCNIFKYKTETRKSLHSLSPFGFDDQLPGVSRSPVKTPRKVPRSPYKVVKLCDLGIDDSVRSVGWALLGTHLAVGTSNGKLLLWDASRCKRIRTMEGHRLRVGALAWSSTLLSSGSRDKSILQRDIRTQEDYVSKLKWT